MQAIKQFLLVAFILLLSSCAVKQPAGVQDDGKIAFTFLQLNDVYEIAPLEGGKVGGMARVETIHQELLRENPNTYLFMLGDFLNPSLLGTVAHQGERIRGKQMIEVMNAMRFDLVTFGNHEFDLNKKDLQKRLDEATFNFTSSNVRQRVAGDTYPFFKQIGTVKKFVSDTHIMTLKDADGTEIKVGFFSVTIPSNPQSYVAYNDIYSEAKRAYEALQEKTEFVIGLTHVGVSQDKKIAALLPEVPLILGGHEHNNMLVSVGNTKIAKADANAKTVYVHKLLYNTKSKSLSINSELKPITDKIVEDTKVAAIVNKWNAILETQIKKIVEHPNEIIYTAKTPLDGRDIPIRSQQTNLGKLITEAMSYGFNNEVDCALVNGGSIRLDDQLAGDINSVDIFRVLPFGGGIVRVKLKGYLLKEVLNYGRSKAGSGAYLQRYLADFDETVGEWKINGKSLEKEKIYTVAFSDYLLKGRDIPFLYPDNKGVMEVYIPGKEEMGSDIRKVLIHYLKTLP